MITTTLDLPLREYVQGCDALYSFCWTTAIFKSSQEHKDTLRYHTRNTEQFSRIRGWNVKNGKVSELQMFITETKSFLKQIKLIFYSGKETEKWGQ